MSRSTATPSCHANSRWLSRSRGITPLICSPKTGLVAFTDMGGRLRGCNVYVGGGMGRTHNKEETFARTADCLGYIKGTDVLPLVQAVVALQRDHGDRKCGGTPA